MSKFFPGRGLDIGTGFIVEARRDKEGNIVTKSVRDSFLEVIPANKLVFNTMKKGLLKSGVNFFEDENSLIILGQDSLEQSVERQVILQRPMSKGVISPTELKALPMFKALLKELLGSPIVKNERVAFTVPAAPIDGSFDIVYHKAVIESILTDLGFSPISVNEAHAVSFSQLEDDNFTGLTLSLGSGMSNFALVNLADLIFSFSVTKGGDYIDYNTALSLGFDPKSSSNQITPNLVTYVKESGVDILNQDSSDKVKLSISAHYKNLIKYVVSSLLNEVNRNKSIPRFIEPITLVVVGGTSKAINFETIFNQELKTIQDKLPFIIKKVVFPEDALEAVAKGCLIALLSDE